MKVVGILSVLISIISLVISIALPDKFETISPNRNLMIQQMQMKLKMLELDSAMIGLKSHVVALQPFTEGELDSTLQLTFETDFNAMNGSLVQNTDVYYKSELSEDSTQVILVPFTHVYERIRASPSVYSLSYIQADQDAQSLEALNYVVVLDFKKLILPKVISDLKCEMGSASIAYQLIDIRKHQVIKEGTFSITPNDHVAFRQQEKLTVSQKMELRQVSLNSHFAQLMGEKLAKELRESCAVIGTIPFPEMR